MVLEKLFPSDSRLAESHLFEKLGRTILVNVRTGRSFEVDEAVAAFVNSVLETGSGEEAARELKRRWGWWRVGLVWNELRRLGFLNRHETPRPPAPKARLEPITALDLNVTHRCNLACRYCYGAYGDLLCAKDEEIRFGPGEGWMSDEVAAAAFEFLLKESGGAKEVSVILFGGEPLANMPLIRRIIPRFRQRAAEAGKKLNLSTATNGTLLSEKTLRYLIDNQVGIQFSFDGPPEIQDDQRCDRAGKGTYARVTKAARRLFKERPGSVTARATLTRRHMELIEIVEHLLSLGFENVHVEPATGIDNDYGMSADCLPELLKQFEDLAVLFLEKIDRGELLNFSNFVKHIRATNRPEAPRFHPCGAGRGYICVDPSGVLYVCHRFTGMKDYAIGNIFDGLDNRVREEIARLHVDARPGCSECWARYFCGGGCWRVNVGATGRLARPDLEFSCVIQRRLIELAMAINARLADADALLLADKLDASKLPYE